MVTEMNDCQHNMIRIHAYIDKALDKTQCLELESHIAGCENCRILVNTLKKTIQLVQMDGQEIQLSVDARNRLLSQLGLEKNINDD